MFHNSTAAVPLQEFVGNIEAPFLTSPGILDMQLLIPILSNKAIRH